MNPILTDLFYEQSCEGSSDYPEVIEAATAFDVLVKHLDEELMRKIDDAAHSFSAASEKQGFVNGFRYAMNLMLACAPERTTIANLTKMEDVA